jgi:hypothetical protein
MKIGLEDERVLAVAAADVRLPYWSDLPAPVPRIAKQGGEARPTVETGKAEPVDGPIPRDQRSSLEIADDRIVFYLGWQLRSFLGSSAVSTSGARIPGGRGPERRSRRAWLGSLWGLDSATPIRALARCLHPIADG